MKRKRVNNCAPQPKKLQLAHLNVAQGIFKLIKILAKNRGWVKEVFRETVRQFKITNKILLVNTKLYVWTLSKIERVKNIRNENVQKTTTK